MKILTKKKQKELINLIGANQLIMNAYNTLEDSDKIQAYSSFCENSAEAIFSVGGLKALTEAKNYLFFGTSRDIKNND